MPQQAQFRPIPAALTTFVGRGRELNVLTNLIRRPDVRLISVVGVGGCGKTRLALEVVHQLSGEFRGGAAFVDLAAIKEPELVPSAVAEALNLGPARGGEMQARLVDAIGANQVLLLVDNFEHLLPATSFITDLLSACACLVVLVTSRAVLHAPGEHIFELGPFEVPHPDGLTTARAMGNEAVQLFVERAQAANSEFGLTRDNAIATAELCRRLDGLPLAIELAAARVRLLPPRALLEHLPPGTSFLTDTSQRTTARQSTLWNTLNWSHALLRPAEKTLFRRLAVFSAGCSPEAMEAVCNATHELGPVASELAASLADKSLVTYTASGSDQLRVTQLETVREFAWHELESCGESGDIQSLHAHYFADLAERLSSRLRGQAQFQAFAQLERELPNIRAALHWASRTAGQFVLGLTFATNLNAFWEERGYWTEGRNWLERFLGKVDENAVDPALLARALTSAGNLANFQGFDSVARGHLTRGLSFWRRQRTPSAGLATCLRILARATSALGDLKTARALCEEALAIATELAAWAEVGLCANVLGAISRDQGDLIGAVDYFQRSLATFRQLGDLPGSALVLWNLGLVSESNGDLNQARSSFEEGLDLSRRAGDRKEMARCRFGLARVAAEQDAAVDAANLAHEALSGFREMGSHLEAAQVLSLLALMELRRNQSETARAHLQESLNLRHIEDPRGNLATALVTLATPTRAATAGQLEHAVQACVLHLAEVEERRGQVVQAAHLLGILHAIEKMSLLPNTYAAQNARTALRNSLRNYLGEPGLAQAERTGFEAPLLQSLLEAAQLLDGLGANLQELVVRPTTVASSGDNPQGLSAREIEIVSLIAAGLSNSAIATRLVLSTRTVERHIENIYAKLGVHGRAARAAVATYAARNAVWGPGHGIASDATRS